MHSHTHTFTDARARPRLYTERNLRKQIKRNCIWQRTILLVFFYNKKTDWYLAKIYCFRASAERNVVDFVLFYDSLNRGRNINTNTYIHTGTKISMSDCQTNTNTTTTLAHTQKATGKGWIFEKRVKQIRIGARTRHKYTETHSRVDTWDTYTNKYNTRILPTYIHTYTYVTLGCIQCEEG